MPRPNDRFAALHSMLPFKLVYQGGYDLNLGEHVFPSQKFRLIAETLLREGIAASEDFLTPGAAADEDILRVHTGEWVNKLKTGTLSASEIMKLEIPFSREAVDACWPARRGDSKGDRRGYGCASGEWDGGDFCE
jgi:acetoin utilization deacetylase AcuC-like enzyme